MRECLIDYCGDHPQCTAEELEKIFGSPEEVARDFLEDKGVTRPSKNKNENEPSRHNSSIGGSDCGAARGQGNFS